MNYIFTRQDASNKRFADIDTYLGNSVRYDVFHEQRISGILITNKDETYGSFMDDTKLYRKKYALGFPNKKYSFLKADGAEFATVTIQHQLLGLKREISIEFRNDNSKCILNHSYGKKEEGFDFLIQFIQNGSSICIIENFEKGKRLASDVNRPLEGNIEMHNVEPAGKVLVFLFATQLYFWLDDMNF